MASPERNKLKDIHLASCLGELNKLADPGLPADRSANPSPYIKSADKVFLKAQDYDLEGDEEYAYMFYMRYFNIISLIKKSSKYSVNKKYYDNLIGKSKTIKGIERAEALLTSLDERYETLRAQKEVGKKVPEKAKGKEEDNKESQQITIDPKESSREIVEKTQKQGNSLSSSTDKPTGSQQRIRDPGQSNMEFEEKIQTQGNNLSSSNDKPIEPRRRLKELEQRNVELKQKNAEFEEKMRDQANKLSSSTDKLAGSQKKLHELEQRNKELEERVQEHEWLSWYSQQEIQELEQINKELEERVQEQGNKHKWSQRKMQELEQRNVKLEEKLRGQENKIKHLTELDRYEVGEGPRGICLVINNVNFLGEDERRGGEIDEKDITVLFSKELHFIVEIKQNLGGYDILKTAQEIAAKDHSKYAAFVFIIMSHGDQKDVIYGVDSRKARVEDLMSEFIATKCPTLENKPKLFFIQACRGRASDPRMARLSPADNTEGDSIAIMLSPDSSLANGVSPQEADFLLAFATVPGYKSWRSKKAGSWFVQVLVDVIRKYHRHHHLIDMLTVVNKEVADIANDNPDVGLSFQVPAPSHTLRAQVFL